MRGGGGGDEERESMECGRKGLGFLCEFEVVKLAVKVAFRPG